ncbi:MAG: sporulation protein YqfD [Acutalibacteraceae bacterium]|nr:sporulation protein YqfD [Acutalibacteraceae bacterium]
MLNRILRWLRGYVIFTAVGKFPERIINLAMMSDITIINPIGAKGTLTAQVSVEDYKTLCSMRKRAMVKLHVIKKVGLPFALYKNKKRKGLLVGAVLFAVIINILSMFVWNVQIEGNNTVSTYEMQECLKNNGIYVGALKKNIDVPQAERSFSLQLGKVGWMSVNLIGNTASVEMSESYAVPEIVDETKPCNLKATKTGQVLKMDIREGKNSVAVGDGVAKGQLLVSGIVEIGETGKSRFVHSEGEVYAGVRTSEEIKIPKKVKFENLTETSQRRLLSFMNVHLPIDYISVNDVYGRRYTTESFVLNDVAMPINIVTEYNFVMDCQNVENSAEQAKKQSNTLLALNDVFIRWNCDIKSKKINCKEDENDYIFTADYYCIENIAEAVPINIVN